MERTFEGPQAVLKGPRDGVEAARQPALHDHERQFDIPILLRLRLLAPGTDVARYFVVEGLLFGGEFVSDGLCVPVLEERLVVPVNHLLLQAAEEEPVPGLADRQFGLEIFPTGCAVGHRLLANSVGDMLIFLKEILVEQQKQSAEGILSAAVGGRGEEQKVIGLAGKHLDCPVSFAFFEFGPVFVRRKFMGLVDHHEVPLRLGGRPQAAIVAGEEIDGHDKDTFFVARELAGFRLKGCPITRRA